jgi:diamine N-acetyltransferase
MINYGNVHLFPVEAEHVSFLVKCGNDGGLDAQKKSKRKTCLLEQERKVKESGRKPDYFIFEVSVEKKRQGVCELLDIDWIHRSGRINLYLEDPKSTCEWCGSKILNALLGYAFNSLDLHRLYIDLLLDDEVFLDLFKKYGFRQDVRKRSHSFSKGSYCTVVELSILEQDWAVQP